MRVGNSWVGAVILFLLAGCDSSKPEGRAASSGPVVARVGNTVITRDELTARLDEQPAFIRARYDSVERKKEFLEQLVRSKLLLEEARKQGLDKDPEVQVMLEKLLVQRLLQKHAASASDARVSEEELQSYYREHAQEFVRPERVRVSHQLLAAPGKASRELEEDLGFKTREELVASWGEAFAAAAFGLQTAGQLAQAPTERGIHLIRLTSRQPGMTQTFEMARQRIESRLQLEKRSRSIDTLVAHLRKNTSVEIDEKVLEQIDVSTGAPQPPADRSSPPRASQE